MTLIATHIDANGIVLATDSNLTVGDRVTRQAPKNFELPHLRGGLSIAGCYAVDGIPMDEWMPRLIAQSGTDEVKSLGNFADILRKALDSGMRREEKELPTLIHIAGYATELSDPHPEFYFVRNVGEIDARTGDYTQIRDTFEAEEQFWSRDCEDRVSRTGFANSPHSYRSRFYANGFPSGRAAYLAAYMKLGEFLQLMWSNPDWSFRPPKSLGDSKHLVRMIMATIHSLFEASDYPTPIVGGEIQIIGIPLP